MKAGKGVAEKGGLKHRIPVIDRMIEVLDLLAARPEGATISDLVAVVPVPRTTVYRILNSLTLHGVARRSPSGVFTLGPKLLQLASKVSGDRPGYDLGALAQPVLEKLAGALGEAAKLSVPDGDRVMTLVAVQGTRNYALSVTPGERLPMHAGAAGKVLLAHLPEAQRKQVKQGALEAFTPRTLADQKRLSAELARIRRQGWAQDKGEFMPSIQAFAAPVIDASEGVIAAVSVPYLAGAPARRQTEIRDAVVAAAEAIGAALPGGRSSSGKAKRAGTPNTRPRPSRSTRET